MFLFVGKCGKTHVLRWTCHPLTKPTPLLKHFFREPDVFFAERVVANPRFLKK